MGAWFENIVLDLLVGIGVFFVLYSIGEAIVEAVR